MEEKKKGEKAVERKEKGRSRRTPTHAVPTPVSSSFSFLFFSGERNEQRSRGTQGPNRFAPTLSFTLQSSPFRSIPSIPPSVPSSPSTLLSSSLLLYLPLSLPPSVSFHVVTHYSIDISSFHPSVPPTVSPLLVLAFTPMFQPGRDRGREGVESPDGQTLNSRGEGRDDWMKGETRKQRGEERLRGEERNQNYCKQNKRPVMRN